MGVVTDLIYDVRGDIASHCPSSTLEKYDASLVQICKWENDMFDTYSISPINKKFWQRPYTVFGAACWFMSGAIATIILAVFLALD